MSIPTRMDRFFQRWAASRQPFSLVLRWFVVFGTAARVGLSAVQWQQTQPAAWWIALLIYAAYASFVTLALLKKPAFYRERWFFYVQLGVDTLFCSIFFYLSGNVDSDLYLNYLLPLVLTLERQLSPTVSLLCFALVSGALLITLSGMAATCTLGCTYGEVILRGFVPRVSLGLMVFVFGLLRNEQLKSGWLGG